MIENELPHPSISQRTFLKQSPHLEDREKKREQDQNTLKLVIKKIIQNFEF